jgi:hypothetical protein
VIPVIKAVGIQTPFSLIVLLDYNAFYHSYLISWIECKSL